MDKQEKFMQGRIDIHLGNGNVVTYRRKEKKVMVLSPDGNPWSVKTIPDDYTLEQFCAYCERMAETLKTKVFPWTDQSAASVHPAILPA